MAQKTREICSVNIDEDPHMMLVDPADALGGPQQGFVWLLAACATMARDTKHSARHAAGHGQRRSAVPARAKTKTQTHDSRLPACADWLLPPIPSCRPQQVLGKQCAGSMQARRDWPLRASHPVPSKYAEPWTSSQALDRSPKVLRA